MSYRLKTLCFALRLSYMRAALAVGNSALAQHIVETSKKNYEPKKR